ncbi:hypothetical protein [Luteirhabdus pelagi]|uniref:hypothetical protein n=1 Tax=Luteirhabdus pelagi TaxID=2792783 RepID=UPI001939331B|nr:hypothetical protein [Luteirhabdus pelagi]
MEPNNIIRLPFIHLACYDHYVVSEIGEGITFGLKELNTVFDILEKTYPSTPFISIAHRVNDYTIDPICFLQKRKVPNLMGIAVVYTSDSAYQTALFERNFYDGTYELFQNLEKAIKWSEDTLAI